MKEHKKNLDREIEVVRNILRILYKCKKLYQQENQLQELAATIKDIETVKTELLKLIAAKEAEKGESADVPVQGKRSRTSLL
jgi:hypothetical protein